MVRYKKFTGLMCRYNCIFDGSRADSNLANFSFFYHLSYVEIRGKFPYEVAKEICNTKFFHRSLFLSNKETNLSLDDCITNASLHTGISQHTANFSLLSLDYDDYCLKYKQYRGDLINLSKEKEEEFYIETLYLTSFSALKETLKILEKYNLLPKGISN